MSADIAEDQEPRAHEPEPSRPWLTKRTIVGLLIFLAILAFFLTQTRLPAVLAKLPNLGSPATARDRSTFSLFMDPASLPEPLRWVAFGLNLWDANAIGMFFAILLGGAVSAALAPEIRLRTLLSKKGALGAGLGGGLGLPLFMCSACSAPVSIGFYRAGASLETALGVVLGSALFNPVGILAIFLLMPFEMAVARVVFGAVAIFLLVPLISQQRSAAQLDVTAERMPLRTRPLRQGLEDTWWAAVKDAVVTWWWHTIDVAVRLVPAMFVAGFAVGAVLLFAQPQRLSDVVGSTILAVLLTAAVGTMLQLPTLFEIPLVLGVMALGLGTGPAVALLLTAPSSGIITFTLLKRDLGWRIPTSLMAGTFILGSLAGLIVDAL